MSRTGDQWIEATGGLSPGESPDLLPAKAKMIAELEGRLISGTLSEEEFENTLTRIRNLRGVPPVEFDYDSPDDDD
jgi:hypothetical protein